MRHILKTEAVKKHVYLTGGAVATETRSPQWATSDKITLKTLNDLVADYVEEEHFWVNTSRLHDLPIFFLFVMLHVAFLAVI